MEKKKTLDKILSWLFVFLFILSFVSTYYVMVVQKDFLIYTEADSVPDPSDFILTIIELL